MVLFKIAYEAVWKWQETLHQPTKGFTSTGGVTLGLLHKEGIFAALLQCNGEIKAFF